MSALAWLEATASPTYRMRDKVQCIFHFYTSFYCEREHFAVSLILVKCQTRRPLACNPPTRRLENPQKRRNLYRNPARKLSRKLISSRKPRLDVKCVTLTFATWPPALPTWQRRNTAPVMNATHMSPLAGCTHTGLARMPTCTGTTTLLHGQTERT